MQTVGCHQRRIIQSFPGNVCDIDICDAVLFRYPSFDIIICVNFLTDISESVPKGGVSIVRNGQDHQAGAILIHNFQGYINDFTQIRLIGCNVHPLVLIVYPD